MKDTTIFVTNMSLSWLEQSAKEDDAIGTKDYIKTVYKDHLKTKRLYSLIYFPVRISFRQLHTCLLQTMKDRF